MKIPYSIIFNIGTLFISISALIVTLIYNNNQNTKWDALNKPKINPTNVTLVAFEEMDTRDAINRNWGYNILHYPMFKDGVYNGRSRIYSELVFWDPTKNERAAGNRVMTTFDDVNEEAKRLNFKGMMIKKHLVFTITYRNSGQLSANNVEISLQLKDDSGKIDYPVEATSELAGGETRDYLIDFFIDANAVPAKTEHFISTTKYEYAGKIYSDTRKIAYNMFRNTWGFE
jgi:hypothetical protein